MRTLLLLLFAICCLQATAQDMKSYTLEGCGCEIKFPTEPTKTEKLVEETVTHIYFSVGEFNYYNATCVTSALYAQDWRDNKLSKGFFKGLFSEKGAKVLKKKNINRNGVELTYVEGRISKSIYNRVVIGTKGDIFFVLMVLEENKLPSEQAFFNFVDSFKCTTD